MSDDCMIGLYLALAADWHKEMDWRWIWVLGIGMDRLVYIPGLRLKECPFVGHRKY
jgi:hypothetical protein